MHKFWPNMFWATFWAIFSPPTHLVTLLLSHRNIFSERRMTKRGKQLMSAAIIAAVFVVFYATGVTSSGKKLLSQFFTTWVHPHPGEILIPRGES
jgi:hypothetical protein